MSFLTPVAFGLAALIPVIIAMYLLKLRRTEQVVSSVYLWRRMVRDLEANAPWQRLRRNLLLILQLLFLALLILALARPFSWAAGASSQALILILDTSASMAATDVSPSRFEAAKATARGLVDGQSDDSRVTVITASDGAQVAVASSQDRRQIHQAIDGVQVGTGGSNLTAALELASAIAARQPETEIVVLSDGRVNLPERLAVKGHLRYLPVGQSGDNQAISNLSLEPAPGDEDMTAFVQVTNYGQGPAERRLSLRANGGLVNVYDLEIPAGELKAVVADGLPPDTRVLEAGLEGADALPLDDRAWAVYRDQQPASVTLVTEGNLFLETGLALLPGLEVTTIRPEDYEEGWKTGSEASDDITLPTIQPPNLPVSQPSKLTIFDTYVPTSTATLPAGNLLFVAPARSTELFTVTGVVDQPLPRPVDVGDPLLEHVNLAEVSILDAARIPTPAWARPVIAGDPSTSDHRSASGQAPSTASGQVTSTGSEQLVNGEATPLLFAGDVDGRRVAVLAFDLRRSDLPLQVAFPLLLANLTGWLAPGSGGDLPTQVAPGTAVAITPPAEAEAATVTRPDGSTVRLVPEGGGTVFADTEQLGVYEVAWDYPGSLEEDGADRARFAVNLSSPQESDVRPAGALAVPGTEEGAADEGPQRARREWWRSLALIALTLLVTEWLVYHRASLARLRRLVMSDK